MDRTAALKPIAFLATCLVASPAMAADGWGASWSFGPTTSRIVHAKTTLVPGRLPPITPTTGPLFLWPGMSNPTSDLIQTTMDAWANNKSYCGAASGQWCVEASVFGSFGQRNGLTVAIDPDDHVTIEYELGTDGETWTQTVTSQKLGKVVSTLQSASGPMPKGGFGFATEADADSFTIDTQYYLCSELHLAEADPHFGSTGVGGVGAEHGATGVGSGIGTAKNVHTPDGGLTWLVDLITLPAMNPQGKQTAPPSYGCSGSGGSFGTGGAPGAGGMAAAGGATGTGGTGAAGGGTVGAGGTPASGGEPGMGSNLGAGGTPGTGGLVGNGGTGGVLTSTGGNAGGGASTTLASGGSNMIAGSGGVASGGSLAGGGQSALAGNSSTSSSGPDSTSSCSCSVPARKTSRGLFMLVLSGAALLIGGRRLQRSRTAAM